MIAWELPYVKRVNQLFSNFFSDPKLAIKIPIKNASKIMPEYP
jgi:hypothetical protein